MLSLSRIALMAPIVVLLISAIPFHREYAVAFMLLALITDALDGYFARRFNQVSELGKVIDPLADKTAIGIVIVLLTVYHDIAFWYTGMVVTRDLLIFTGGIYITKRTGKVLASNYLGKITVVLIAVTIIFALLRNPMFHDVLAIAEWSSVVMMLLSFASYTWRFFAIIISHPKLEQIS